MFQTIKKPDEYRALFTAANENPFGNTTFIYQTIYFVYSNNLIYLKKALLMLRTNVRLKLWQKKT